MDPYVLFSLPGLMGSWQAYTAVTYVRLRFFVCDLGVGAKMDVLEGWYGNLRVMDSASFFFSGIDSDLSLLEQLLDVSLPFRTLCAPFAVSRKGWRCLVWGKRAGAISGHDRRYWPTLTRTSM